LNKQLNILICPLEWGLGHASRMIPVARRLLDTGHNVIIGSGKLHLSLFREELPGLKLINFTGFKPGYSRFLPQYLSLALKIPILLYHIVLEHITLKKIVKYYDIDIVISDNRFGLWNRNITTVYVTHMLLIPFPEKLKFLEPIGSFLHRKIINKYSFCFVPDLPGDLNLSGRLSHGFAVPENVRYIGILSRFSDIKHIQAEVNAKFPHNTVILSGPEPQRGILKQKLIKLFENKEPQTVIFEGNPEKTGDITRGRNIISYSHLPSQQMREIIEGSELIITRSGYTTLMELVSMNCTALIIPTPGQTEQEYLADYLSQKGWFNTYDQDELKEGINMMSGHVIWPDGINRLSLSLFDEAIRELLEKYHKGR
jgi:UDP-N-acetylglucosamine transferase subunit ALG13